MVRFHCNYSTVLFEFPDPTNLGVDKKIVVLCHLGAEIWALLCVGGHLGCHLEYLNFSKGKKVATDGFEISTLELYIISHKTLSVC